jgi:hypothetical protein
MAVMVVDGWMDVVVLASIEREGWEPGKGPQSPSPVEHSPK